MALRKEDKDWIIGKITTAIGEHLNPHGWRRLGLFFKTWIPLAAAISILLALLALAGAGWNFAFTRVDKEARFQTQTASDLGQINKMLTGLQSSVTLLQAQIASSRYSVAPIKDLKKHRDELNTIRNSLAQTPQSTPGYWPAAFQVITLLSKATSSVEPRHPLLELADVSGVGSSMIGYPPGSVIKLHKQIRDSVFTDAIIYLDFDVVLYNVTFINCTIVLPEIQTPPKPLEQIGNQLLSA